MAESDVSTGRRVPPRPVADLLREIAGRAVADGELAPTATAPQIRAYLRGQGAPCTPLQARVVHDALRIEFRGHLLKRTPGDSLGSRLASARKAKRISRAELSRMVGCSESYLSYLEAGRRSPSTQMLHALAAVLGREPEWLWSGRSSAATAEIGELLATCRRAMDDNDLPLLETSLDRLLGAEFARPLSRDESDQALLYKAHLEARRGGDRASAEILEPLVVRLLDGKCALPPLRLGQDYMAAVLFAGSAGELAIDVWAEAVTRGRRILASVPVQERDDSWWRLAATSMASEKEMGNVTSAIAQAVAWLTEVERSESRTPSGVAALHWNLGLALMDVGRVGESLPHLETALRLHDVRRFPRDAVRLRFAHAMVLMMARPDRVEEAIEAFDSVVVDIERNGYLRDLTRWRIRRAQAEIIAGRGDRVPEFVGPVLEDPGDDLTGLFDAWLAMGDAAALRGDVEEARAAYERGAEALSRAPERRGLARNWRDVADRYRRLGLTTAAAEAFSRALTAMDVPELPGLPPPRPPSCPSRTESRLT